MALVALLMTRHWIPGIAPYATNEDGAAAAISGIFGKIVVLFAVTPVESKLTITATSVSSVYRRLRNGWINVMYAPILDVM